MRISEAVSSFLSFLQFEKRFSQHTLIAYKTDLEQFSDFSGSQFQVNELEEVQPVQVRTWLANLRDENGGAGPAQPARSSGTTRD